MGDIGVSELERSSVFSESPSDKLVVAAIDFGTTYTGYAFTFRESRDKLHTHRWNVNAANIQTPKAPTVVLLKPDKSFHSFGYEAEEKYCELVEDNDAHKWFYFKRFKMKLYETKRLRRDTELKDVGGKTMPAMDIFAMVIDYLKHRVEDSIIAACAGTNEDDILWVLTVPAIWSDAAKQFMREAAQKAGIADSSLKLVLEPEAAAVYVNSQKVCKTTKYDGSQVAEILPKGQIYIVADLGGGTADMAVHELSSDGNIREVQRARGGACGGIQVDIAFRDFLDKLFGKLVMKRFSEKHGYELIEIQDAFEIKKRSFAMGKTGDIRLKIPVGSLGDIIKEVNGGSFDETVEQATRQYGEGLKFKSGKMIMAPATMESFFKNAVENIVGTIQELQSENEEAIINTLVLVGGFAESPYVTGKIKSSIKGMRVILPPEPSLSVLFGAVMMVYTSIAITERIARYTYGLSFVRPFRRNHPQKLKHKIGDTFFCASFFVKLIEKGHVLAANEEFAYPVVYEYENPKDVHRMVRTALFMSSNKDPKLAENDNCEVIGGTIEFPRPADNTTEACFLEGIVVGESDFTIVVRNTNTDHTMTAKIEFLGSEAPEMFSPGLLEKNGN